MNYQHQQLANGKWNILSFVAQMANIGSEVERTILWREKGNELYSSLAFDRALELLEMTIADNKNKKRLKEIVRVREMLIDYFKFSNEYASTDKEWRDYFYSFNYASRLGT